MSTRIFKCIIIDDDKYAIDGLSAYVNTIPNLELVKTYQNPLEALIDINRISPLDLVLLDIHMPLITGIQLSKEIRSRTQRLIFTTAYTQYGYDAFEAEADGYLLKPFSLQKFTSLVFRVLSTLNPTPPKLDGFFFVKNKYESHKMIKVWYEDIVAVEGQQNYIMLHLKHNKILTYMSLSDISNFLNRFPEFVQFQRSFIIAKSHIESIVGNSIKMDNGLEFVVGDKYKESFHSFLKNTLLKAGD